MFVQKPKFGMGWGMEVQGAGLTAQQQQPCSERDLSSGAKPGEEKAPEPPGCSAGQQPLVYLLNKFKNSFVLSAYIICNRIHI